MVVEPRSIREAEINQAKELKKIANALNHIIVYGIHIKNKRK